MKINRIKLAKMLLKFGEMAEKGGRMLMYEGDFAVGLEVFVEDENGELVAIEDGQHELEDGRIITTAEGKITEIKEVEDEAVPEEEVAAEEEAPEMPDVAAMEAKIAELEEALNAKNEELAAREEEIANLKEELDALNKKVEMSVNMAAHQVVKASENKFNKYFK